VAVRVGLDVAALEEDERARGDECRVHADEDDGVGVAGGVRAAVGQRAQELPGQPSVAAVPGPDDDRLDEDCLGDADRDRQRGAAQHDGQGGAEHGVADRREVDVEDRVPEVAEPRTTRPRGGVDAFPGSEREGDARGDETASPIAIAKNTRAPGTCRIGAGRAGAGGRAGSRVIERPARSERTAVVPIPRRGVLRRLPLPRRGVPLAVRRSG